MTMGLTTECNSRPNLNQSQLRGLSTAGQKQPAAKNRTAAPASQGQPLPSSHQFNTVSTPRAAPMTLPKERSELRATFSSREKLSCVVWVLMNYALAFEGALVTQILHSASQKPSMSHEARNRLIAERLTATFLCHTQ